MAAIRRKNRFRLSLAFILATSPSLMPESARREMIALSRRLLAWAMRQLTCSSVKLGRCGEDSMSFVETDAGVAAREK